MYEIIRKSWAAECKIENRPSGEGWILTLNEQREDSRTQLRHLLRSNRLSGIGGIYAVCSAHPAVIEAAFQQSLEDRSVLLVESTSSQVNQFGGYTGLTPCEFAEFVHSAANTRE